MARVALPLRAATPVVSVSSRSNHTGRDLGASIAAGIPQAPNAARATNSRCRLTPLMKIRRSGALRLIELLILIVGAQLPSGTARAGDDTCPPGPFETDIHVIAAAIAAHPLHPRVWDASPLSDPVGNQIADGFASYGAGGL